jgi:glutamate-1-semialdehyde aminotransferase
MANGFPLSAIVGRADIMQLFDEVFFSFTHGGEAISLAAGLATIRQLKRRSGPDLLWRIGSHLQQETNAMLDQSKLKGIVKCVGLPPFTCLRFDGHAEQDPLLLRSLFQQETVKRGVLTQGTHMLSLAHDEKVLTRTLAVYREVFAILADAVTQDNVGSRLEGPPVRPVLRKA